MILVEYACRDCARRAEHWTGSDVPTSITCDDCGGTARRRFGGTLLGPPSPGPAATPPTGSGHCHGSPGDCVLTPTAARMLDARIRGDRRAIDRETAHQEQAISAGTLDPHRAPVSGAS